MSWSLGSIRVFVTEKSGAEKQIIARLNPLGGGTVLQFFGYDDEIAHIKAYVVGETNLESLKTMSKSGESYNLTGYGTNYGDFYVSNLSWSRVPAVYQTLTTDCYAPLYTADLELYPE